MGILSWLGLGKPASVVTMVPKSALVVPDSAVRPPATPTNRGSIVEIALAEYGIHSTPGADTTPRILEYLRVAGLSADIKDDETAWCGTFASYCAATAGYTLPKDNAGARSWLNFGTATTTPRLGDIVVFWRESPDSWKGHVAIYVTSRDGSVWVLGGNQGGQVSIVALPTERVLGYRRPS